MKKALTFALALIGSTLLASTVNWGFNTKSYFGTDAVKGNAIGYLVYLGEGTSASWNSSDYLAIAEGTSENYSGKQASSLSKISGSSELAAGSPVYQGASVNVTDGSSVFGVMMTYVSEGTTYYALGDTFTFDTSDTTHYEAIPSDSFTWQASGPGSNADTSAQGWTAVPEPSVAILGLLGLGMLLKRRRA